MVTIFTYHIHTSIYYNTCVKCEKYINKYYNDYGGILLPPQASHFSTDYVNMQDTYVNMQEKYVSIQNI